MSDEKLYTQADLDAVIEHKNTAIRGLMDDLTAERDATKRLLVFLAERIMNRLAWDSYLTAVADDSNSTDV